MSNNIRKCKSNYSNGLIIIVGLPTILMLAEYWLFALIAIFLQLYLLIKNKKFILLRKKINFLIPYFCAQNLLGCICAILASSYPEYSGGIAIFFMSLFMLMGLKIVFMSNLDKTECNEIQNEKT